VGGKEEKELLDSARAGSTQTQSPRLGQGWFDSNSVTTTGSDLITVAAATVADMVESWDLHNFLIQIANYACE
jgi:hypothetical protein